MFRAEMNRRSDGAPERDVSEYSAWRLEADPENLELIEMYGSYLVGQHAGMTDALSLEAVEAAMRIEGVPEDERPALARRLIALHGLVREIQRPKEKEARG